ncbi:MAG TPA: hypothetical protein VMS76_06630 [Planctomycetota bacterium]|nr:hypothetical protein [Planctomycetota bacterium]
MARLELAPELMAEALLCAIDSAEERGTPAAEAWHQDLAALSALPPIPDRERAFAALVADWFERLALDVALRAALELGSRISSRIDVLYVRRAARASDEGAKLFDRPAAHGNDSCGVRLVLSVLPARFKEPRALFELAARELLHAEDLLDPAFGHRAVLSVNVADDPAGAELVDERVRVL